MIIFQKLIATYTIALILLVLALKVKGMTDVNFFSKLPQHLKNVIKYKSYAFLLAKIQNQVLHPIRR